jgi:hypothetical protein
LKQVPERIFSSSHLRATWQPVTVSTFVNRFEAEVAPSALEAAAIDSTIAADDAGGMQPHL